MILHKVRIKDLERNVVLYYYLDPISYKEYVKPRHISNTPLKELTSVIVNSNSGQIEDSRWSMETIMDYLCRGEL